MTVGRTTKAPPGIATMTSGEFRRSGRADDRDLTVTTSMLVELVAPHSECRP